MNRMRAIAPLLLLCAALVSGCASRNGTPTSGASAGGDTIRVTTTIGMIGDVVKNVGGKHVEVTGLMGPGVDPHLYKATASDVAKLERADVIFYGGLDLEGRMTDVFEKMKEAGKPTIPVSEAVPVDRLRRPPEFEGRYDPHIWFDVTLWKTTVDVIRDELSRLDPDHAEEYKSAAARYQKELDDLNEYTRKRIASIPKAQRALITAHDAFGYFGDQYGMEVHGLQGTSTATEAGAGDVRRLAQLITDRRIKAVFVESSVPKAAVEAVQAAVRARGWNVAIGGELFSDAMGQSGTPEGTYVGMVRHNVDTIVEALK